MGEGEEGRLAEGETSGPTSRSGVPWREGRRCKNPECAEVFVVAFKGNRQKLFCSPRCRRDMGKATARTGWMALLAREWTRQAERDVGLRT